MESTTTGRTAMKKTLSALALIFLSPFATAAGEYDGVWAFDTPIKTQYFSVHQNGGTLVVAGLAATGSGGWFATQGPIIGNAATTKEIINTMTSTVWNITWKYEFSSASRGVVTMVRCVPPPNQTCPNTDGTSAAIVKIF